MTICFTGRRPKNLYGYDKEKYNDLVDYLTKLLEKKYEEGYRTFISGGAQGFDQLAFWAVNRLKKQGKDIKNIVYIPFKGQERTWLGKGLFSKEEYNLMLSLADEIVVCSDIDVTSCMKYELTIALHHRNHMMVDNSDLLIGIYPDDSWKDDCVKGGTAECLRYANDKHKDILTFNPFTLEMNV